MLAGVRHVKAQDPVLLHGVHTLMDVVLMYADRGLHRMPCSEGVRMVQHVSDAPLRTLLKTD